MLNCGWFEPVLRNAQPVLMVVSCLCLCLGSCFPSSEPLNRISSLRRRSLTTSTEMPHISRTLPHRTLSASDAPTTARPSKNVFISSTSNSNNDDPYFRNMDTVLKDRLESSGQISSNAIPRSAGPVSGNSTNNDGHVNSSINALTDNSLEKPRKSRHRQRPVTSSETSTTREQTQIRRYNRKQKKRERLSRNGDMPKPSRTSTQRRLEPRTGGGSGKRRKSGRSRSGLESRTARTQVRGFSFCNRISGRWNDIRQLSNLRSWTLAAYPDGTVDGTRDQNSINSFLVFVSHRRTAVRIFAEAADKYVCMNNVTGEVYASEVAEVAHCIFQETISERSWTYTYSLIRPDATADEPRWYLGISKKGEVKSGRRVRGHQEIAHFVPMSPTSFPEETCPGRNPDI